MSLVDSQPGWPVREQRVYPAPAWNNRDPWDWRPRIGETLTAMHERKARVKVLSEMYEERAKTGYSYGSPAREVGPFNVEPIECKVWGKGGGEHKVDISFTQFDEYEDCLDMAVFV